MKRLYVVALALILVGCGGDPPPAAPAGPSPTPSSTAVAAPVMPELAKEDSKEGAVAFVKYYVAKVNHAQATGEIGALISTESPTCRSCNRAREGIEDLYRKGGHLIGGEWRLRITGARRSSVLDGWNIDAVVGYSRQVVRMAFGREPKVNQAGHMRVAFFVERRAGLWRVNEWLRTA